MPRVNDWQSRLAAVVLQAQREPFAWGTHDCARFAARCVQAVSGLAPALPVWTDERTAARALKLGGGLAALAAARLGAEVPPAVAQPGDVGLFDEGGREALAVWGGAHWMAPAADGLAAVRADAVSRCWRAC